MIRDTGSVPPSSVKPSFMQRVEALNRFENDLLSANWLGTYQEREAALRAIMENRSRHQDLFFPVAHGNTEYINYSRERLLADATSGQLSELHQGQNRQAPRPSHVEVVTDQSHPGVSRQLHEMNERLNQRYGTRLPAPQLIIVDNDRQTAMYDPQADTIVISRHDVRQGHAPAMIAHELSERMGVLRHGDMAAHHELRLRERLFLESPEALLNKHRANECREDADAMALVGAEAYQKALQSTFTRMRRPLTTDQLNDQSARQDDFRGEVHPMYPTNVERHQLGYRLQHDPALLHRFDARPEAIRFDGACGISEISAPDVPATPSLPSRQR